MYSESWLCATFPLKIIDDDTEKHGEEPYQLFPYSSRTTSSSKIAFRCFQSGINAERKL